MHILLRCFFRRVKDTLKTPASVARLAYELPLIDMITQLSGDARDFQACPAYYPAGHSRRMKENLVRSIFSEVQHG
jgi:hypothetical protein